jgi:hypothetical protein
MWRPWPTASGFYSRYIASELRFRFQMGASRAIDPRSSLSGAAEHRQGRNSKIEGRTSPGRQGLVCTSETTALC